MSRPLDRLVARLSLLAALLSASAALVACDDPDPAVCVSECVPAEQAEPGCEIVLVMDANCEGYVAEAEVAVGQCLEPGLIHPGETFTACARPLVGDSFTWTVRSETWQWGPWKDSCGQAGDSMSYALGCK